MSTDPSIDRYLTRRTFLRGTVASAVGGALSGCLTMEVGSEGVSIEVDDGDEGSGSTETVDTPSAQPTSDGNGSAWPMFGFDLANTNNPDSTGPKAPESETWAFNTRDAVVAGPAVVDGVVFTGSMDGRMYAIDAIDGTGLWAFETEGVLADVLSTPTVVDGQVIFSNDHRDGGFLYALDSTTGQERWSYEMRLNEGSSPTVFDGMVYIGDDRGFYAIEADSGAEEWTLEIETVDSTAPAVADGLVFFGSRDDHLYAVDAATGTEQWSLDTGDRPNASPAVADGLVFTGTNGQELVAVDAATGSEQWALDVELATFLGSSPAVADGLVFIGSEDHHVYALDANTGAEQWSFETADEIRGAPAIADGLVYVGSLDNHVYAIDVTSGSVEWQFQTEDGIYASPAIGDGVLYIGSTDNHVYAIEDP